jgi:hypothetical protein
MLEGPNSVIVNFTVFSTGFRPRPSCAPAAVCCLGFIITIYAPMIYTAPCIMFWMHAYPSIWQVGGGWALEIESFLGPRK